MANQEIQAQTHYLPDDPSRTPLSREDHRSLMRDAWRQRMRYRREGACVAPKKHSCSADCSGCPYRRIGSTISLDSLRGTSREPAAPDNVEEAVTDHMLAQQIIQQISKLDPIDQLIIDAKIMRYPTLTDRECAEEITQQTGKSISHQAVSKRYNKALAHLREMVGVQI